MSEPETEEEFIDARPSEEDDVEEQEATDDPVFLDEMDGPPSEPSRPAPPPASRPPTPPPTTSSGVHRVGSDSQRQRASSDSGRAARPNDASRPGPGVSRPPSGISRPSNEALRSSSSGRMRAIQGSPSASGAHGALGAGKPPRPPLRADRSRAEEDAAVAALEARVLPAPAGDPYLGRDLGPFRVERFLEIDRGERRYVAIHSDTQRVVLLRLFPFAGTYGEEFKRLADRAERAVRIESPNLDAAYAAGRTKDAFYAGFEPPVGPTLTEVLATEGPLAEADALVLLDQVSKALGAIHAREVNHLHLSTDTIRRLRPGAWVVESPALARPRPALTFLAAGGDVLGRPGFIAPETVDSGEHTKPADLYALGCVVWAALVGRPPFQGDDEVQVLLDQLNQHVPALATVLPEGKLVTEGTQTIVQKLTGYTHDVRYRDVHDLQQDLKTREKGERIAPLTAAVKPEDLRPKAKLRAAATSILILALLNAALLTLVVITFIKAFNVPLGDPTEGLELPLPQPPATTQSPPSQPPAPPPAPPPGR